MEQVPILGADPKKWVLAIVALLASMIIGRFVQSFRNGEGVKGAAAAIWLGTNKKKVKKTDGGFASVRHLCVVAGLCLLVACAHRLEQGGAYAPLSPVVQPDGTTNQVQIVEPEFELFMLDSAFELADNGFRTASRIEQRNRDLFWRLDPKIKWAMDRIRKEAWNVAGDYTKARAAYLANPTPAGLDDVSKALAKMNQLTAASEALVLNK
jgi:hypothetical protein